MVPYLHVVVLPEDNLGRPLIQTLHFALVSDSVLPVCLLGRVITALARALGQVARLVHLTFTATCSLS